MKLLPVLFIVFLVLKLTGLIAWSWWWVTAPLWGGAVLMIVIFILAVIFASCVKSNKKEN